MAKRLDASKAESYDVGEICFICGHAIELKDNGENVCDICIERARAGGEVKTVLVFEGQEIELAEPA